MKNTPKSITASRGLPLRTAIVDIVCTMVADAKVKVNCLADECVCADEIRQVKERYRRERSFNGSKDQ